MTDNTGSGGGECMRFRDRQIEREKEKSEKLAYKIIKTHISFDRQNLCRSAHNTRFTINHPAKNLPT